MHALRLIPILLLALCTGLRATEAGFSYDWNDDAKNVEVVGATDNESEYTIARLSMVGGMFRPGEAVGLSLVRPATPTRSAEGGSIEAVFFNAAVHDPHETGFVHPKAASRIARNAAIPVTTTDLSAFAITGDEWKGSVQLPEAFGMYALLLKRSDGSRTILGTVARVPLPQPRVGRFRQVMCEWGLPGGPVYARYHSDADIAVTLSRAGVGLVRKEIQPGVAAVGDDKADAGWGVVNLMEACRTNDIQVMITASSHQDILILPRFHGPHDWREIAVRMSP